MEELQQLLAIANLEQKVELLADALSYREAGINLLIEALDNPDLPIRTKAYQLLQGVELKKQNKLYITVFFLIPAIALTKFMNQLSSTTTIGFIF